MRLIKCEQGGPDWHLARSGVITASMFSVTRERVGELTDQQARYVTAIKSGLNEAAAMLAAGYKAKPKAAAIEQALAGNKVGDYSEAAKKYAFRLAVERISGVPLDEGFQNFAMRRGNELEPLARESHELITGHFVEPAGFVLSDCGRFGASADGLIDDDGGCEYKCLIDPERIRSVLLTDDISEFMDQIQGCMWITGRQWWHFCLYVPALKTINKHLYLRHVQRDDAYIGELEKDLIEFEKLVTSNEIALRKPN